MDQSVYQISLMDQKVIGQVLAWWDQHLKEIIEAVIGINFPQLI
jgi:hypothetical protein